MRRAVLVEPRRQAGASSLTERLRFIASDGLVITPAARKSRQDRRLRARPKRAALGDLDGRGKRFRQVGEQRGHFGAALEPVLRRQLTPLCVGDEPAFGDAQQGVVGFVILARGKERLVGGDERNAARIGEFDQRRLGSTLARRAVALQFKIKPIAEQPLKGLTARLRKRVLAARECRIERTAWSTREGDQACGLVIKPIESDVRALLRLDFEIGPRAEPHQAAVALLPRGEQHDAREIFAGRRRPCRTATLLLVAKINRERAADDRLYAAGGQFFGKLERTEHIVGVGQRQRRLPVLFCKLGEPRDRQRALKQRIGRMDVQMDETRRGRGSHEPISHEPIRGVRCGRTAGDGARAIPSLTNMADRERRCLSSRLRSCLPRTESYAQPDCRHPDTLRSNDAEHLRPNRNRRQKQGYRGKCQCLLEYRAQHDRAPLSRMDGKYCSCFVLYCQAGRSGIGALVWTRTCLPRTGRYLFRGRLRAASSLRRCHYRHRSRDCVPDGTATVD